jgi:hypothetical protein
MLDTIFWAAVIIAISCGIFIICLELYEEWAQEIQTTDEIAGQDCA